MTTANTVLNALSENASKSSMPDLEEWLERRLPLYGHRNWIVVADSAYPAQSRQGIKTIAIDHTQESVVEEVLVKLRTSRHVHPIIHVDRELAFVDDKDAPGIQNYRDWLASALHGLTVNSLAHEEIIAKLDRAAQTFCVTIFKTRMTIPYTTVFFELDCAYWNADSESRLRSAMRM